MDNPSSGQGALVQQEQARGALTAFKTGNDDIDQMPLATQVWFNPKLMECVQGAALVLSKAQGFVPQFLLGKTETCFSVALTALDAGVSPLFMAEGAFQTPEGKVGYDTRRIQAVVEAKGFFSKPPKLAYSGPWENLIGKFKKEKSDKGKWYTVKTWGPDDAKGCKLKVTFYFRDLPDPVECEEMDLSEVGTHFSTQWATEPKQQFGRLVVRRQLNLKRASLMAGIPCIDDLLEQEQPMKDITPAKEKSGSAGLDEFANEPKVTDVEDDEGGTSTETVVETASSGSGDEAPAGDKPEAATEEAKATPEAQDAPKPDGITLWISADEPARPIKTIPNAIFVLRNEIKDARTASMARTVFNQNMELLSRAGKEAQDDMEAELKRRMEKGDAKPKCSPCGPQEELI